MMKWFIGLAIGFWVSQVQGLPLEGLTDLKGERPALKHDKKVELVVFWATWCPTCKEKLKGLLPSLDRGKDVAVVTVNTDKDMDRVKHYLQKEGVELPVLIDPSREFRKSLKVFSVPHWAVYRRETKELTWKLIDSAPAFEWDRIEKALGVPKG